MPPDDRVLTDALQAVRPPFRGSLPAPARGVGTLEHLRRLAEAAVPALVGVIVGRALHERRFTMESALAAVTGYDSGT